MRELTHRALPLVQIAILGSLTSVLVLHDRFQGLKWRTFRMLAFTLTGLSGLIPVFHGLYIHGIEHAWSLGIPYWILEGLIFLVGTTMYGTHWPECRWPGKFDHVASHGYFHILVVVAVVVHGTGVWRVLGQHLGEGHCLNES